MGYGKDVQTIDASHQNDQLFEVVYGRLRAMAGRQLAGNLAESINATALVHELYLRVVNGRERYFGNVAQFFDYAAKAMRHIVVDRARARTRAKRGGSQALRLALEDDNLELADLTAERTLEIDSVLRRLAVDAPRAARIVELHYFAGLPLDDIAEQLGVSTRTVNREWRFARALLHASMV